MAFQLKGGGGSTSCGKALTQMLMMKTKLGLTTASIKPSMKRLVAMPAKERHAGVVMTIAPQMMVVIDVNRPMGRIWSR